MHNLIKPFEAKRIYSHESPEQKSKIKLSKQQNYPGTSVFREPAVSSCIVRWIMHLV